MAQSTKGEHGSVLATCPCAQVALDVIEELCCEMGLQNPEALEEYILFVVTDRGEGLAGMGHTGQDKMGWDSHGGGMVATLRLLGGTGQSVRPLTRREYVLDVAAETEFRDTSYTFWCRRVVWSQPLKFDNELYVIVHYNQVGPPISLLQGHLPVSLRACPALKPCLCALLPPRFSLTTSRGCSPSCHQRGQESSTSRTWPSWLPSSTEPRTATTSPPRMAGHRAPGGGETHVPWDLGPTGQCWA